MSASSAHVQRGLIGQHHRTRLAICSQVSRFRRRTVPMVNRSGRDATSGAGTGLPTLRNKLSLQRTWGCVRHLHDGRQLNLCLPKFIFFKNMPDVHSTLPQSRCIPPAPRRPERRTLAAIGFFIMASRVSFLFSKRSNPVVNRLKPSPAGAFRTLSHCPS